MTSDQIQGILRQILLGLGSVLTAHGVAISATDWTTIVGGVMAVVAVVWSLVFHSGVNKSDAVAAAGGDAQVKLAVANK